MILAFLFLIVFLVVAAVVQTVVHVNVVVNGANKVCVDHRLFTDPKDWVEEAHLCTFFKEVEGNEVTYHITTEKRGWMLGVKEQVNKPAFYIDGRSLWQR